RGRRPLPLRRPPCRRARTPTPAAAPRCRPRRNSYVDADDGVRSELELGGLRVVALRTERERIVTGAHEALLVERARRDALAGEALDDAPAPARRQVGDEHVHAPFLPDRKRLDRERRGRNNQDDLSALPLAEVGEDLVERERRAWAR